MFTVMGIAILSVLKMMGALLFLWFANFVFSLYYNVATLGEAFDKAKLKTGILKILVILVGTLLLVVGIVYFLDCIAQTGIVIEGITDGFSVGAIIIIYGAACFYYGSQAILTLKGIFTK